MITGIVSPSLEPIIRVHIADVAGQTQAFDLKIDTGFTGWVSLPIATVAALGLALVNSENIQIGDGSCVLVAVHSGVVMWDGKPRTVAVHALGVDRYIGTGLLAGHDLAIRVRDGGPVSITLIP